MSKEFPGTAGSALNSVQSPVSARRHPHPRGFPARSRHTVREVGLMALNLATLNVRGLRDSSKCARMLAEFKNLSVYVAAVKETHFLCAADYRVLENDFAVFSSYGSRGSAGISLLVGCRC